jgi:hypothetical protein
MHLSMATVNPAAPAFYAAPTSTIETSPVKMIRQSLHE